MTREEEWVLKEKYDGDTTAPGFVDDCRRLARGEPAAYVIGWQPFLDLKIWLDSKPLIPRPETEWWTNELLASLSRPKPTGACWAVGLGLAARSAAQHAPDSEHPFSFLDLCAGSGAIGSAALAGLPNAEVYFGELDPAHEATIRKNIRANGLDESRADVRIGDLFAPFSELTFDVIAINPPYIPSLRTLEASVTNFEPHEALFAEKDGLSLIRRIATELPHRLSPDGIAWIECDTSHSEAAKKLYSEAGLSADVIPDQYGEPRIIAVSLP